MQMDLHPNTSFRPYLIATIVLDIAGWGCTAFAIIALPPTVWARWLLFFGGTIGLTGLFLPVTWFLNLRFPSSPLVGAAVILRQAVWIGVYGALLIWLQQERLVTLWTGLGLAAGLGAIEYLIRMRENARWQPGIDMPPSASVQPSIDNDQPKE